MKAVYSRFFMKLLINGGLRVVISYQVMYHGDVLSHSNGVRPFHTVV